MLRKVLLILLLAAGIAAQVMWSTTRPGGKPAAPPATSHMGPPAVEAPNPPSKKPFGSHRAIFADYDLWSRNEQINRVDWVMQGIWGAFHGTTGPGGWAGSGYRNLLVQCPIARAVLAEELRSALLFGGNGAALFRRVVTARWFNACGRRHLQPALEDPAYTDTWVTYKKWEEAEQRRYVDGVMEGIEEAFDEAGQIWPEKTRAVFEGCAVEQPAISVLLAKAIPLHDDKHPLPLLIFAAYEAACRTQKQQAK